jgi:hypothetical protein
VQWNQTSSSSSSSSSTRCKSHPSSSKLLLTVFWDLQASVLEHYMDWGVTVMNVFPPPNATTCSYKLRGFSLLVVAIA